MKQLYPTKTENIFEIKNMLNDLKNNNPKLFLVKKYKQDLYGKFVIIYNDYNLTKDNHNRYWGGSYSPFNVDSLDEEIKDLELYFAQYKYNL